MKYILFTGGGSAGHVVPNLAVMNELKYGHKIAYMGTDGIERSLVEKAGYPFFTVNTPKLVRKFTLENLKIPVRLRRSVKTATDILKEERPDLVFSKGGFVSYPAVCAAAKLKIPVLTHESDLSAGLCTKLIAKKCEYVLTSFPETAKRFKNGLCTGSPVRKEIFGGERSRARKKYDFTGDKPVLLVLGGGSGSKALNDFIRSNLNELLDRFYILHLCGKGNAIQSPFHDYVQREFESDMGNAYACADVVLSRGGSNTVFEILALKKPAVLVPLMKSSRGDQAENAAYFERKGVCLTATEESLKSRPKESVELLSSAPEKLVPALTAFSVPVGTPAIVKTIKHLLGEI